MRQAGPRLIRDANTQRSSQLKIFDLQLTQFNRELSSSRLLIDEITIRGNSDREAEQLQTTLIRQDKCETFRF